MKILFGIVMIMLLFSIMILIANISERRRLNRLRDKKTGKLTKKGRDREIERLNKEFDSTGKDKCNK